MDPISDELVETSGVYNGDITFGGVWNEDSVGNGQLQQVYCEGSDGVVQTISVELDEGAKGVGGELDRSNSCGEIWFENERIYR